jgi:hypothetical protein
VTEKSNQSEDASMQLILDFIGPFVVHFTGGKARIHAPLCTDHHANILTDSDDVGVAGWMSIAKPVGGYKEGFVYSLKGPTPSKKCNCLNPEQLLIVTLKLQEIDPDTCHFVLEVPNPNTMVPLLPDKIWMHKNGAHNWVNSYPKNSDIVNDNRARGVRFIYSHCPKPPDIQPLKQPKESTFDFEDKPNPPHSVALGLVPLHYHITLRFVSNGTSPDEHHEDAYNCFQEMRTLIPTADKWRTDFADVDVPQKGGKFIKVFRHGGPIPVDCGAMVLVVQE